MAGENIAAGVSTDQVDEAVHDFVVRQEAYPSPLGVGTWGDASECSPKRAQDGTWNDFHLHVMETAQMVRSVRLLELPEEL